MKRLSLTSGCIVYFTIVLLTFRVYSQVPGAGSAGGINAALTKLFGKVTAFSAQMDLRVVDKAHAEVMSTSMEFAISDKKIRVAVDMSQMHNKEMPPGMGTALRQMGMAQVISIIRPDKKSIYILYPDQKAFLTMPLPEERAIKIQRTELGKETLDEHPCIKTKAVLTDDKGDQIEAVTWNASDLKDFPIQIESTEKEQTSIMHFKQIRFEKPEADQFEAPADYQQFKDPQELLTSVMKKGAAAPPSK